MNKFWRINTTANQEQKLQKWCSETWKPIYRYVYKIVQNREEAEDITQETYTKTLNKLSSEDDPPPNSYLKTVALNLIRDRWRRAKLRGTQVPLEEYMLSTDSFIDNLDTKNLVQHLLDMLPEDYRTVLKLRIIQGYSRNDTASKMGRTEASIRGLQYRAMQNLKALLDKHLEEVDK